jgi:hypothetical protein
MNERPIPERWAGRIYDLLVEEAGAHAAAGGLTRHAFTYHQSKAGGCREYRFGGKLGFGGKFWNEHYRDPPWRVGCYAEDETPETLGVIERTNARLAAIYQEYKKAMEVSGAEAEEDVGDSG